MGKKRKKKKYSSSRNMELVCVDCHCLWRFCDCNIDTGSHAFIFVNKKELEYYFETGLIPDHRALLYSSEKPEPILLAHPPQYRL